MHDKVTRVGLYKGRVEQRVDPDRMGRLRVRVAGVHGDEVPTEHLPWAWPRTMAGFLEGGSPWVPPLGAWVWVDFEAGDYEYPVWSGGWWGTRKDGRTMLPDDAGDYARHRDWPTSSFGGEAWGEGDILRMEEADGALPEDAPNNYPLISPHQKRLELDDRRARERVVLADYHDNAYWTNSERGVTTLEAVEGVRSGGVRRGRGLTISSSVSEEPAIPPEEEGGEETPPVLPCEAVQLYTSGGWYVTLDDRANRFDISSPSRHRVVVDETTGRVELWTHAGHRVVLDETARRIVVSTPQGRQMILDDGARRLSLSNPSGGSYVYIDDAANHTEVRGEGTLSVKAGGDMSLGAGGRMTLDAPSGIYLNSGYLDVEATLPAAVPHQLPADLEYPHPTTGEVSRKVPRAMDYPEYKHELDRGPADPFSGEPEE